MRGRVRHGQVTGLSQANVERQMNFHIHITPLTNFESPNVHFFGLCEEARVPRRNLSWHNENNSKC